MGYSIFEHMDINDVISYLETCGYDVVTEEKHILEKIKSICKELKPNGYIDKEDAKKLLCDYIDFWMVNGF